MNDYDSNGNRTKVFKEKGTPAEMSDDMFSTSNESLFYPMEIEEIEGKEVVYAEALKNVDCGDMYTVVAGIKDSDSYEDGNKDTCIKVRLIRDENFRKRVEETIGSKTDGPINFW